MAKRFDKNKKDNRLERAYVRNWIICGISLALIIVLYFASVR